MPRRLLHLVPALVVGLLAAANAEARFLTTPDWTVSPALTGGGSGFGGSVSTAGDVNGDGYSDILVAASAFSSTVSQCGKVEVYLGGPNLPSTTAAWSYTGSIINGHLGQSLSFAGDVNNDGYDDVIIGEPGPFPDNGRAYIFMGSAGGLGATPARTIFGTPGGGLGASVTGLGDVNGDGYADIGIGEPFYSNGQTFEGRILVYHGGPAGISAVASWIREPDQPNRALGAIVAAAGDVNGDGYDDILATQAGDGAGIPSAMLFPGGASGPGNLAIWAIPSTVIGGGTDVHVSTAGDVNGDGYADILVGDTYYGAQRGRTYVFPGGSGILPTSTSWWQDGDSADAHHGTVVAPLGDVNGDGFADYLTTAPLKATGFGWAYVEYGSATGPGGTVIRSNITGTQVDMHLGLAGGSAGDVNGDGLVDLVLGAPGYDTGVPDAGQVQVYFGRTSVANQVGNLFLEPNVASANLGAALAVGDFNGDGHSDLAAAATELAAPGGGHGGVSIYYGNDSGLPTTPALTIYENGSTSFFGNALANAGDVNGDGYEDLLVGTNGLVAFTKAYLYYGGQAGVDNVADWVVSSPQLGDQLGTTVAGLGDVNGDGYADIAVGARGAHPTLSNQGAVYAYYGGAAGPPTSPSWTKIGTQASGQFGAGLAGAGDVNADGYDDIIIGAPGESNGQSGEGLARVYLGSASGLGTLTNWTKESNQAGAAFGAAVAGVGDVDGDGVSDVVIAAPLYDATFTDNGRISLYLGGAASPLWVDYGVSNSAQYGQHLAAAGDINADGRSDFVAASSLSNGGYARIYDDAANGDSHTLFQPFYGSSGRVGEALAGPGDFNADGVDDMALSAPGYDGGQTDEGRVVIDLGGSLDGLDVERRQIPVNASSAPIALHGRTNVEDRFKVAVTARSAAGRRRVRLEWDVRPAGAAWGAVSRGSWVDTGAPVGGFGSRVGISEVVSGLTAGVAYHWRVRTAAAFPPIPHGLWLYPVGNAGRESDIRGGLPASAVPERPAAHDLLRARVAPNPFVDGVAVAFTLPVAGPVELTLFDVQGRRVAVRQVGWLAAGEQELRWDGRADDGAPVVGGVYFARLVTAAGWTARKILRVE